MHTERAAQHLEVIRTLMERSTLYRRALAPVMGLAGVLGATAAAAGCWWAPVLGGGAGREAWFVGYWLGLAVLGLGAALFLVRRQAIRAGEPFWSLPTRRVVRAALPAGGSGLVLGGLAFAVLLVRGEAVGPWRELVMLDLPLAWAVLYGCALHAAGFFMPRGIKWFGWSLVLGAWALLAVRHLQIWNAVGLPAVPPAIWGHGVMGLFFGVWHLAYGGYLAWTEPKTVSA